MKNFLTKFISIFFMRCAQKKFSLSSRLSQFRNAREQFSAKLSIENCTFNSTKILRLTHSIDISFLRTDSWRVLLIIFCREIG